MLPVFPPLYYNADVAWLHCSQRWGKQQHWLKPSHHFGNSPVSLWAHHEYDLQPLCFPRLQEGGPEMFICIYWRTRARPSTKHFCCFLRQDLNCWYVHSDKKEGITHYWCYWISDLSTTVHLCIITLNFSTSFWISLVCIPHLGPRYLPEGGRRRKELDSDWEKRTEIW